MTRGSLWFVIATVLVSSASGIDGQKCSVLTIEVKEKIRALADEHSCLTDILLPEQTDTLKVAISSVPENERTKAAAWIARLVQERWLPRDITSKLVALKDVKQWEKRDKKGVLIFERVGDFLTLDHEVSGYGIHVQEAGGELSLRVDLPQAMPVADDPDGFIRKCLKDFLNIPDAAFARLEGEVQEESPLYVAFLRAFPTPLNAEQPRRSWEYLFACTDGRFFFVWVPEIEEGYNKPRAKPGLRDRF